MWLFDAFQLSSGKIKDKKVKSLEWYPHPSMEREGEDIFFAIFLGGFSYLCFLVMYDRISFPLLRLTLASWKFLELDFCNTAVYDSPRSLSPY